jgi:hypothetical protein
MNHAFSAYGPGRQKSMSALQGRSGLLVLTLSFVDPDPSETCAVLDFCSANRSLTPISLAAFSCFDISVESQPWRDPNPGKAMQRRGFMKIIGGAAAGWPLAARAQQPERMRRVAILTPYPPADAEMQGRVHVLRQELERLGWTADVNIQFDERWTTDNMDLVRANASGLIALNPDVVVANGGRVIPILMQLTRTIPICHSGRKRPGRRRLD